MSENITWNSQVYIIPDPGDSGWGQNLTNFFIALPAGALQKSAGLFTLTADVDFGASFGVTSLYLKSRSASIASAGVVRLAHSDSVAWENHTTSGNLLLVPDGSDNLTYNGFVIPLTGGTMTLADGSVSTPSLNFTNDLGSGLYRAGSHDIGFAINGSKVLDFTANGLTIPVSGVVNVLNLNGTNAANDLGLQVSNGAADGASFMSAYNGSVSSVLACFGPSYVGTRMAINAANCAVLEAGAGALIVGTNNSFPTYIGANAHVGLTIDTSQHVTAAVSLISPLFETTTANLATTGFMRLANSTDRITWRNNANNGNLELYVSTSDVLTFNGAQVLPSTLTSAHIFVGNVSNIATDVAVSGDVAITNAGVTSVNSVQSGVITNTMVNASAAIALSKLAALGTAKALQSNSSTGFIEASAVTNTELGFVSGVTSAIQTQINTKAPTASPTFTGVVTIPTPFTLGAVSVTATGTELNFVAGVTSAIQTQINTKATDSLVVHLAGTETITGSKTISAFPTFTQPAGNPAVKFSQGTSDATVYQNMFLLGGAGGSTVGTELNSETQTAITTAKTIYTRDAGGALLFVYGSDGAGNDFFDEIFAQNVSGGTATALHSLTSKGSPTARTYTQSGTNVQLAMASGTYTTRVFAVDMAPR